MNSTRETSLEATAASAAEDREWVEQAIRGQDSAVRRLVEKHQGAVYGLSLRMMRDPELAAEAAQDAFVRAFRGLDRFESRSRFTTWLYRITLNVCYDRLARRPGPTVVSIHELSEPGNEPTAGANWGGDQGILEEESRRSFEEALGALSDTYRLPFVMRQIEERSYEEIAEVLSITVTNAKVRVHRAREMMVAWLKQKGAL